MPIRRCVRRGLIKMRQVPLNRYADYLTPQGFGAKSRLTAEYLAVSFNFFRRARVDCADLFERCAASGWRNTALYGAGDLAEMAILSAGEAGIETLCVIDLERAGRRCAGVPVVLGIAAAQVLSGANGLDGIVLNTQAPQARFDALPVSANLHGISASRVAAPSLLGISTAPS
jgi:hypothetical protein